MWNTFTACKSLLLTPYYCATYPFRVVRNRRNAALGQAPVMVLYYHRIADDAANSWTLSNGEFERQINWLARRFEFVSLKEAQQRIESPSNHQPAVSITFDDGYAENCESALPLLIRRGIPCTYFVTVENVLSGECFPHDLAMGNHFLPNNLEQLQQLAASGIEIGSHTRTHADLGAVTDPDKLYDELVQATADLEAALDRPVRYFAFPFGLHANLNCEAFRMAHEMGLAGVCSAYGGYNFAGDDTFHLQRIGAEGPMVRLKNWVTVDPLKQLRTQRYEYERPQANAPAPGALVS